MPSLADGSWNQYGTFASHLAPRSGRPAHRLAGFDKTLVMPRTPRRACSTIPAPARCSSASRYPGHRWRQQHRRLPQRHRVRRGDETKVCTTTVNDPCAAFGYRIHQAAFFNDLARLRITDAGNRVVFDDVLDFENRTTAVPLLKVTDAAGIVLFEQDLPQMGTNTGSSPGPEDDVAIAALAVPRAAGAAPEDVVTFGVSWRGADEGLRVVISGEDGNPRTLQPGSPTRLGGYVVTYEGARAIPAVRIDDMPGAAGGSATVQMLTTKSGTPYLFITGLADDAAVLTPRTPVDPGTGYTYTFEERVEASGVRPPRPR
jgi:hypothetical protein